MISSISGLSSTGVTSDSTAPAGQLLATKDSFLKLLVAQIKNQNPLNPSDGVEFLTQLAQFTDLEQTVGIRSELESIRKILEKPAAMPGAERENE